MKPKREPDSRELAARRRRLSIDYDFFTRDAKGIARIESNPLAHAARTCAHRFRRQFLPHYFQSPPRWRVALRKLLGSRILPDFGVIGTVKSGTSDLAATLLAHPNVLCPLVKEFDSADPLEWRLFYPTIASVSRRARHRGVILSPFVGPYLHCHEVASALCYIKPHTKIVINLRNPADLVFSEWKWMILHTRREFLARSPFLSSFSAFVEKALDAFPGTPGPIGGTLHDGIYWHSVAHWASCFGEENVRIFDISEYFSDRATYLQRVSEFVGLPHAVLPAGLPVANRNPVTVPLPAPETRVKLREFFEPYNSRLWDLLGFRYHW